MMLEYIERKKVRRKKGGREGGVVCEGGREGGREGYLIRGFLDREEHGALLREPVRVHDTHTLHDTPLS